MGEGGIRRAVRWLVLLSLSTGIVATAEIVRSPQAHASSGVGYVAYVGSTAFSSDGAPVGQSVLAFSTSGAPAGAVTSPQGVPASVAISPSAGEVYATVQGDGDSLGATGISSAHSYQPGAGASLAPVGSVSDAALAGPAVSPNGQQVFAAGENGLYEVSTSSPATAAQLLPYPPQVTVKGGVVIIPQSLALSPDGSTAFVGGYEYSKVQFNVPAGIPVVIAMSTTGSGGAYLTGVGTTQGDSGIVALAVSPDGTTLWAAQTNKSNAAGDGPQVLQIGLPVSATGSLPAGTALTSEPTALAVAPNGSTVYVGTGGGPRQTQLLQLSTASPPAVSPIALPEPFAAARSARIAGLAVTPDGQTLMVTSDIEDSATAITSGQLLEASIPSDSPTGVAAIAGPGQAATPAGTIYSGLAVTPDQAPVARVAVSAAEVAAGGSVTFSTGPSTVAFGSINGYRWNVSGGSCNSLTTSAITCQFAEPGSYSAQVIETDSAGNSTVAAARPTGGVVFTGATASLVPDGSAKSAPVQVTVTAVSTPTPTPAPTVPKTTPTVPKTTPTVPKTTPTTTLNPQLTVNPGIGPPGFVTQVDGTGFPPNTPLTVTWSVGAGSVQVTTNATGTFSVQMLVMARDLPGTRNAQVATFPTAKAPFLVVPGSLQPGGDSFVIVFSR